ncbi:MAG: hydrogenase maturation protease [Thaumarchaeota archaeon]|nr:hydrogenase maturation protease [Nitrososphaerota archaeon]
MGNLVSPSKPRRVLFIGVGNPIKSDDSVGLYMISKLRREYGASPKKSIRIASASSPETAFSKIGNGSKSEGEMVVIFDAVESDSPPGSIIFANIGETRYGFFATHNIPLRLIPTVMANISKVFVLGIQAENTDIGEKLSETVRESADRVVGRVGELINQV